MFLPLIILIVVFSFIAWKHFYPPVIDNKPLSDAIMQYAVEHFTAEDLVLKGEVSNIRYTEVILHIDEEVEGGRSARASIIGSYDLTVTSGSISSKSFRIKHRFSYNVENGNYYITFKRVPGIKYYN